MILLRKAKIYDNRSTHHLKQMDILIDKGIIVNIAKNIKASSKIKVIESNSLSVSPGWLDIGTYNGEPGYEYREDLQSVRAAAQNGGYCGIAPFPTGNPTIDSKGQLHYLLSQEPNHLVSLYPVAALSRNREGKEMSELLELHHAGAVAFTDGVDDQMDHDQFLRSMLYLKGVDALTIYNTNKEEGGHLHEGRINVQMGLQGIPAHIEESKINQAIKQSEYVGSKILIHNISTSSCLKNVRQSSNRENISISVPFINLIREDKDVLDFDLNLKVIPPLRDRAELRQLSKGVESGIINVITSNHTPLSPEEKDQPFGLSMFGASTLDNVFAALNTFSEGISTERIIHCLSVGPHECLNLPCPVISKNQKASITAFDPGLKVTFVENQLKSKSKNNPFIGLPLQGKVIGIINGKKSSI